jgi:hypothetical protein
MRREARLRPEYAHLYPMIPANTWESAAITAERIAAIRLVQLADTYVLHDRVLTDAHFEFRGGSPSAASGSIRGRGLNTLKDNGRPRGAAVKVQVLVGLV